MAVHGVAQFKPLDPTHQIMSNAEIEIRKEQQTWLWRRWVLLVCGVLVTVLPFVMRHYSMFNMDMVNSAGFHYKQIVVPPFVDMMPFLGIFFLFFPLGRWHGDPKARLLLEIIDREREKV